MNDQNGKAGIGQIMRYFPALIKDSALMRVILLVALPLGILGEGVVRFSMPIMLTHHRIPQPVIGYLIAIFSIGFFITNRPVARMADRIKQENIFLLVGLGGFFIALSLMGALTIYQVRSETMTALIIAAIMLLLGMFRGFLVSPSIAFVSKTAIAEKIGKNLVMSFYNLVQSVGMIIGPLLIMSLLIAFNYSFISYVVLASAYLMFVILFYVFSLNSD